MAAGPPSNNRAQSKLFEPLKIADGKITLKHRVVLAPLTRNRGTPLNPDSTFEHPNRVWVPNDLIVEYYAQRATDGGLLISEAVPPSLEGNGMPGVPGLFVPEQIAGWKKVTDAVHAKGGFIYAQLWHSGRVNVPQMTGTPILAPSSIPWEDPDETFSYPIPHTDTRVRIADYPPTAMSTAQIRSTIEDYCAAARAAVGEAGFDGVEVHGANGYLPEHFLSSNSNRRTDAYGGATVEGRCRFPLELMAALADAVGQENVAIRLSPFGLFNQARGDQRLETWSHLCRELRRALPRLSYVSFIEPRFEQLLAAGEKDRFLASWGLADVDLAPFRAIFSGGGDSDGSAARPTPFFSAGGFNDTNAWGVLERTGYDALLFGRWFTSNPDLVERLRHGWPLRPYDRSRFYGPFEDNAVGYVDYPFYKEGDVSIPAKA
ncbi:hypothetical protein SLS62_000484 [Diatrype stigma]|uniref:NADH:flavin oxidoreductase/NADH oxidase N-terminal domain-containing protein n=1 Tax=Diatrype stigma TaxID=117547 RepID=A0AAN9VAB8_9PEZI